MENITAIKTRKNGQWVEETNSYIRNENSWKKKNNLYANDEWHMPNCKYSKIKLVIGDHNVNYLLDYIFYKKTSNTLFIDWGDGSSEQTTLTEYLAISHTYTTKGEYTIKTWVDSGDYVIGFIDDGLYYGGKSDPHRPGENVYIYANFYDIREVFLGLGVKYIDTFSFGNLANLHKVRMLEVEEIAGYSFALSNLTEIAFGNKLKILDDTALDSCSFFEQVIFPECLEICCGARAKVIVIKAATPPKPPTASGTIYISDDCKSIKVPAESVEIYKTAPQWSKYADKITAI